MINFLKNQKEKTIFLFIFPLIIFLYFPITKGYFQHDEIFAVTRNMSLQDKGIFNLIKLALTPSVAHFVPIHQLLVQIYISSFSLNYHYYAYASIFAHLFVVFLVYLLVLEVINNKVFALLGSILFGFSDSGHQATSWPLSDINTHGAAVFGLMCLIFLFKFLNTNRRIYNYFSLFFLFVSLLFKEITIGFFILLPVTFLLYVKEKFFFKGYLTIIIGSFLAYLLLRLSMIFFPRAHPLDQLVIESQSYFEVFVNLLTFPIKIISQTLIPPRQLLAISKLITGYLPWELTGIVGTTQFDIFVENKTLFVLEVLIFGMICFFINQIIKKQRKNKFTKPLIFGFIFVIVNSLIYTLSPYRSASVPIIDSRNLYLPSFGMILMIVSVFFIAFKNNFKKFILLVFIFLFIAIHVYWLNKEITNISTDGQRRKVILQKIKSEYPVVDDKVVFYTDSDRSFYGLPEEEKILPFQTNFGYNLIAVYLPEKKYPNEIADGKVFLRDLTDQGYKEVDGKGFGYYRNFDFLRKSLVDNNLSSENVISYRYYSKTSEVIDITEEIREKL